VEILYLDPPVLLTRHTYLIYIKNKTLKEVNTKETVIFDKQVLFILKIYAFIHIKK
jgi:hypothetical protein